MTGSSVELAVCMCCGSPRPKGSFLAAKMPKQQAMIGSPSLEMMKFCGDLDVTVVDVTLYNVCDHCHRLWRQTHHNIAFDRMFVKKIYIYVVSLI